MVLQALRALQVLFSPMTSRWAAEKSCPGDISETVRDRSRYLVGILVKGYRCATLWCDLVLTIDLSLIILTLKICLGYILETIK